MVTGGAIALSPVATAIASEIGRSHVRSDVLGDEKRVVLSPLIFKVGILTSAPTAPPVGGAVECRCARAC